MAVFGNKNFMFKQTKTFKEGLVAYYPFDENGNDFSGNNYNATAFNTSPTFVTDSIIGNSVRFPNYASYYQVPNNSDFSFTDANGEVPFTIMTWVNSYQWANTFFNSLFGKLGGTILEYGVGISQGILRIEKYSNGNAGGIRRFIVNTTPLALNTWYHAAYTDDGLNTLTSGKWYVNGVAVNTIANTSGTYEKMINTTASVNIGMGNSLSALLQHYGNLDETYIYKNRKFEANEILEAYNKGLNGQTLI